MARLLRDLPADDDTRVVTMDDWSRVLRLHEGGGVSLTPPVDSVFGGVNGVVSPPGEGALAAAFGRVRVSGTPSVDEAGDIGSQSASTPAVDSRC